MEYVNYILIILLIMAVCVFIVRLPGQYRLKGDQLALAEKTRNRKVNKIESGVTSKEESEHKHLVLERELSKVPTPWGWPGHHDSRGHQPHPSLDAEEVHGVSESLHRFIDRLVSEKETVESREYLLRKDESLRALVEDRYGRASRMKQVKYQKVKAPRLRDPSLPPDQMDNFPSGKADQVESGLKALPGSASLYEQHAQKRKRTELKELKKPWGW